MLWQLMVWLDSKFFAKTAKLGIFVVHVYIAMSLMQANPAGVALAG